MFFGLGGAWFWPLTVHLGLIEVNLIQLARSFYLFHKVGIIHFRQGHVKLLSVTYDFG
jgi:hypothetical protein